MCAAISAIGEEYMKKFPPVASKLAALAAAASLVFRVWPGPGAGDATLSFEAKPEF